MKIHEAIEQLEKIVVEVRQALSVDDKTALKNALALRDEGASIDDGASEFDVVVFGDLNRFKSLNDQHGHDAGDLAIYRAGEKIGEIAEMLSAKAFRQSGDEFVILLQRDSIQAFRSVTHSFKSIPFTHNEKLQSVAMSFGYAVNDGKAAFSDLLRRAEAACQHAKVQGDGTCVAWSKDLKANELVTVRERCQNCGARISCDVPSPTAPVRVQVCPICSKSF